MENQHPQEGEQLRPWDYVQEEERKQIGLLRERLRKAQPPEKESAQPPADVAKDATGLCFSGGGIRSATFGLGVLQGLAKLGSLAKFDYLSTVSGGGYIGSWLLAWARQKPSGILDVQEQLKAAATGQPDAEAQANIQHLRSFSNYLTPKKGFLSADTWTAMALYGRNLLLNLLILLPTFILVLLLARLVVVEYADSPDQYGIQTYMLLAAVAFFSIVALINIYRAVANLEPKDASQPGAASPMGIFKLHFYVLLPLLLVAVWLCWLFQWEYAARLKWQSLVNHIPNLSFLPSNNAKMAFFAALLAAGLYLLGAAILITKRIRHTTAWLMSSLVSGLLGGTVVFVVITYVLRYLDLHLLVTLGTPLILAAFILTMNIQFGLIGRAAHEETREWGASLCGWASIYIIVWLAVFGISIYGALWLYELESWYTQGAIGMGWLFTAVAGVLANRSKANEDTWRHTILQWVAKIAPLVFIVGLLALVSLLIHKCVDEPQAKNETGKPIAIHIKELESLNSNKISQKLSEKLCKANICITADPQKQNGKWLIQDTQKRRYYLAPGTLDLAVDYNDKVAVGNLTQEELLRIVNDAAKQKMELLSSDQTTELLSAKITIVRDEHDKNTVMVHDGSDVYWMIGHSEGFNIYGKIITLHRSYLDSIYEWNRNWLWMALASVLVLIFMVWRIDINLFSMHAMYANRLIRCYLGGARANGRNPHPVTGFDPHDDFSLNNLTIPPQSGYLGPYYLINTAMNLVAGQELAWQDRKAESFVLTPLYCGSRTTGYRPLPDFGGNITMGNAVAISGAAVSPNMGSYSSPALAVLMTIFNARLGWWIGNPQASSWKNPGPHCGFFYLLTELFSQTNADSKYVNLSDGGHFENLGVYELIRRRCNRIVVCDAGADPDFECRDLSELIQKCRVDFGVEIEIDLTDIQVKKEYWAMGNILYPQPEAPGKLLYIKPLVKGIEPVDVQNYQRRHPQFPHESTVDQFYSESQFESYRMLGQHIVEGCKESLNRIGLA